MISDTKFVLKTHAMRGFYVGGNIPYRRSVNSSFFGVNIAFFIMPHSLETVGYYSLFYHLNPC
jgi:hypothetical protein